MSNELVQRNRQKKKFPLVKNQPGFNHTHVPADRLKPDTQPDRFHRGERSAGIASLSLWTSYREANRTTIRQHAKDLRKAA